MKIFKRSLVIFNFILFLIFSYLYLYVLLSLSDGASSFNVHRLMGYILDNHYLNTILFMSIISIYWVRRWSRVFIISLLAIILYNEMVIFFDKFDKIILVLSVVHILSSIYYYLLWNMELEDVVYCPGFSKYDCGNKFLYDLEVEIELEKGLILPVELTNWDRQGVFCLVNESDYKIKKNILLRIKFEKIIFEEYGELVTSYDKGYGIKFHTKKEVKTRWGWSEFYTIIRDRGYTPNFIKA